MRGVGSEKGVAKIAESSQETIVRFLLIQYRIWGVMLKGGCDGSIMNISSCFEGVLPIFMGKG